MVFDVVEHLDMIVQLVSDLDTEFTLAANTSSEAIQVLVLLLDHVLVIIMDLLVVQVALFRRPLGFVAVRKEGGSVGRVVMSGRSGDGTVVEADRLGRIGGVAGSFQKGRRGW